MRCSCGGWDVPKGSLSGMREKGSSSERNEPPSDQGLWAQWPGHAGRSGTTLAGSQQGSAGDCWVVLRDSHEGLGMPVHKDSEGLSGTLRFKRKREVPWKPAHRRISKFVTKHSHQERSGQHVYLPVVLERGEGQGRAGPTAGLTHAAQPEQQRGARRVGAQDPEHRLRPSPNRRLGDLAGDTAASPCPPSGLRTCSLVPKRTRVLVMSHSLCVTSLLLLRPSSQHFNS